MSDRPFSKLLINESPLQVLPSLAVKVGVNGAMFLQQVHYWITMPKAHERDGRFWVYNSLPEWQEQFPFWSEDTIQRTIAHLEQQGVLLSGNYNEKSFDRTKWYTIDYEALDALEVTPPSRKSKRPSRESASPSPQVAVTITADSGEHDRKMRRPIPETNAETTTKTNTRDRSPVATPQAPRQSTSQRDMGRDIPPVDPGLDYKALWAAIEQHTGHKLLWNWAAETQAVKRIVKAYPVVTPEELIGFLTYLETVFPWSQDPTKQATFSEGAKHFARWYSDGQPVALVLTKGSTNGRTYESPGERREREWMESLASIYGTQPAADHYPRAIEPEPPALPTRAAEARIISLDGRRVG